MRTFDEKLDQLHAWRGYTPDNWKHRMALEFMQNMLENLSVYILQFDTTDEFERKIRIKQCQNMLISIKSFKTMYELEKSQDMILFHTQMMQLTHEVIIHLCKLPML
jgi:hypothetical protein